MWHRTASDINAAGRVRDALRRILQLPASIPIEYKAHGDCLRTANASASASSASTSASASASASSGSTSASGSGNTRNDDERS